MRVSGGLACSARADQREVGCGRCGGVQCIHLIVVVTRR